MSDMHVNLNSVKTANDGITLVDINGRYAGTHAAYWITKIIKILIMQPLQKLHRALKNNQNKVSITYV